MSNHNHVTRDIKAPGKCPGCDVYHESQKLTPEERIIQNSRNALKFFQREPTMAEKLALMIYLYGTKQLYNSMTSEVRQFIEDCDMEWIAENG